MAALATQAEPERVTCFGTLPDGRACGQLLALRSASGGVRVVVKGDETFLPDHRIELVCPSCGKRVRIKPKARAA